MSKISKTVRDAVVAQLIDGTNGFNANIAAAVGTGNYGTEESFLIDFSNPGMNFFLGRIGAADVDESTASTYPMAFLYATRAVNTGTQKFNLFSGMVEVQLDVYVSWNTSAARSIFEDRGDLVEDAIVKTFNDGSFSGSLPPAATYNGDISVERSAITMEGEDWRQVVSARLAFTLNTN